MFLKLTLWGYGLQSPLNEKCFCSFTYNHDEGKRPEFFSITSKNTLCHGNTDEVDQYASDQTNIHSECLIF